MIYLDTSLLVPLFVAEPGSEAVVRMLQRLPSKELAISQWSDVEFTSAISRLVRMGSIPPEQGRSHLRYFSEYANASLTVLPITSADVLVSRDFVARFECQLRAPDALHLAVASRNEALKIATLDSSMFFAGKKLGLPMSKPSLN